MKEVKVTWLDSAFSHAIMLKDLGDSFECALTNSEGYPHSPTRYHCNIDPKKLKWRTEIIDTKRRLKGKKKAKAVEKPKNNYIRERVAPKDIAEYMLLWIEQNTQQEFLDKTGITKGVLDRWSRNGFIDKDKEEEVLELLFSKEIIELDPVDTREKLIKFLEDYNVGMIDLKKDFSRYVLERLIEDIEITPYQERKLILFLENNNFERMPSDTEIVRRLIKFKTERELTNKQLATAMDTELWRVNKLTGNQEGSRKFKMKVHKYLNSWGY